MQMDLTGSNRAVDDIISVEEVAVQATYLDDDPGASALQAQLE